MQNIFCLYMYIYLFCIFRSTLYSLNLFLTGPVFKDIWSQLFFFFSKCIAIVLQNNQTEQEIYVIFGIILYKYNNFIDKYLLGKNAWKVDDQRLMFVLKIWVYRHDLNKYLSCDENIIIKLITLQWIIFSGTNFWNQFFLEYSRAQSKLYQNIKIKTWGNKEFYFRPEIMVIKISRAFTVKV